MFSLGVSDHIMVAHSFADPFFGPAQRLHGATYGVEVTLQTAALGPHHVVMDIGALRSLLRAVLATLDYTNLDEHAAFPDRTSTTERLAAYLAQRIAQEIAKVPPDGAPPRPAKLSVLLRESPVAWASCELSYPSWQEVRAVATLPLRIGWVIYGSLDQISGGYIYDRLVIEELRALGDEVTVLSLSPGQTARPNAGDFDVLVGDELCFRELQPMFCDAPAGLRRVLLIHHLSAWEQPNGPEQRALLALEKAAIDAADACVATSAITADRLHSERLVRGVAVAEPGADRLPRPDTAGQEPSGARVRLLFVGNVLPRKRVLELVEAFAGLPSAHAELVLVGAELDPDYAARVRAAVAQGGVADRVRFLGSLEATGVADQLALSDVLVLPSALEGYGMVLSEALWASVPVIAARVGAAEQLIGRSGAGLLYEPDDAGALDAALTAFVGDAQLRRKLRKAAWQAAEHLPRWQDTALALRATLTKSPR